MFLLKSWKYRCSVSPLSGVSCLKKKTGCTKKVAFRSNTPFFPQDNLSFMSPKKTPKVAFSIWVFSPQVPPWSHLRPFFFQTCGFFSKDSDSIGKTGILETCHVQALVPSVTRSLAKLNEQNHAGKNGCSEWGIMTRWWQLKYFYFFIPLFREDEPILTYIFQMGWFANHQPDDEYHEYQWIL